MGLMNPGLMDEGFLGNPEFIIVRLDLSYQITPNDLCCPPLLPP